MSRTVRGSEAQRSWTVRVCLVCKGLMTMGMRFSDYHSRAARWCGQKVLGSLALKIGKANRVLLPGAPSRKVSPSLEAICRLDFCQILLIVRSVDHPQPILSHFRGLVRSVGRRRRTLGPDHPAHNDPECHTSAMRAKENGIRLPIVERSTAQSNALTLSTSTKPCPRIPSEHRKIEGSRTRISLAVHLCNPSRGPPNEQNGNLWCHRLFKVGGEGC